MLTATVWEVPGRWPKKTDFWKTFARVAQREVARRQKNRSGEEEPRRTAVCKTGERSGRRIARRSAADERLHIADSKDVYCPAIGLGPLERGALAAFGVASRVPSDFDELLDELWGRQHRRTRAGWPTLRAADGNLWFSDDVALPLPVSQEGRSAAQCRREVAGRLRSHAACGCASIRSDVVAPRRWNLATRETDNKATALSRLHMQLLRRVWDPDTSGPTMVIADKHGGRNRYAELLTECLDGRMVWCRHESRDSSIYRVGSTEIHFEARAERHFPVALASMVSKYVRELAMELFNRFWQTHLPTLKPTHGYPTDARRFRAGSRRNPGAPGNSRRDAVARTAEGAGPLTSHDHWPHRYLRRHRHAAAAAEGALGELDPRRHLPPLEFVAVELPRHPADGVGRVTAG